MDCLVFCYLLVGCSVLPPTITHSPPGDLTLVEAERDPAAYQGRQVRWGGTILSVENDADQTWIQILHKRLGGDGRPRDEQESDGRFLMWAKGFLDPGLYAEGLNLTVYGELDGQAQRMVGKHALTLPVVKAIEHHLWKDYDRARYYPVPIIYDGYPFGYDSYDW